MIRAIKRGPVGGKGRIERARVRSPVAAAAVAACATLASPCTARAGEEPAGLARTIVTVTFVRPGGLPDKIGVRRGDVLRRLDRRRIRRTSRDSLYAVRATNLSAIAERALPRAARRGDDATVTLEVIRDDRILALEVPATAKPDAWDMSLYFVTNILPALDARHPEGGPWRAHAERSVRCAARLDWRGAAAAAREAAGAGLEDPDFYAHLGMCLCRLPDYAAAEAAYERALGLMDDHEDALRGMALVCFLTARPREALRFLERLDAEGASLNRFDRDVREAAKEHVQWVALARVDAERRTRGILRPVRGERAYSQVLPVEDVFRGMPKKLAFKYDKRSNVSEVELSDFAVACTVSALRPAGSSRWLQHACLRFSHHTEPISVGLGVSCGEGAVVYYSGGQVRLSCLSCVNPVAGSNRILMVREGHRLECRVNGVTVATVLTSDLPMRFYFSVLAAHARFSDLEVEVPATRPPGGDEMEMF